ncbi:hypothetical protein NEAUS03_1592 [Nematocida ausubeli]|nr:hypothetical protein NEAUS03_1592 [Nematocida ausubeli]
MRDIQKDAIYTAVQLCSAYKKYKAAESEYEIQKKDIDIDLEVLFEEKEELKGCSSKIAKFQLETFGLISATYNTS